MTRRVKRALLALVALAIVGGAGLLAGQYIKSPAQVAAETSAPPASRITVPLRIGRLETSQTVAGTVSLPGLVDIAWAPDNTAGSLPLATSLEVAPDDILYPGDVLMTVADRPIILLRGPIPMIRPLAEGDTGRDVSRLQDVLRVAGYYLEDSDGDFGPATSSAVTRMYTDLGYEPPTDGSPAKNKVIAAPSELVIVPSLPARLVKYKVRLGAAVGTTVAQIAPRPAVVNLKVPSSMAPAFSVGSEVAVDVAGLKQPITGVVVTQGAPSQSADQGFLLPIQISTVEPLQNSVVGRSVQVSSRTSGAGERGAVVPLSALFGGPDGKTYIELLSETSQATEKVAVRVIGESNGSALVETLNGTILKKGSPVVVGAQ